MAKDIEAEIEGYPTNQKHSKKAQDLADLVSILETRERTIGQIKKLQGEEEALEKETKDLIKKMMDSGLFTTTRPYHVEYGGATYKIQIKGERNKYTHTIEKLEIER